MTSRLPTTKGSQKKREEKDGEELSMRWSSRQSLLQVTSSFKEREREREKEKEKETERGRE